MKTSRIITVAMVGCAVAAMAACTRKPPVDTGIPGPATPVPTQPSYPTAPTGPIQGGNVGSAVPGSEQDFVVNIGDRIYFDLDSIEVRPEARPRLDAQAQWLQRYPAVTIRIEGNADERGTREYNLALGVQPRRGRPHLSDRPRHPGKPHHHHQLRQGAPDRRGFERGRLGAQPQRPHRHRLGRAALRRSVGSGIGGVG
jgi:peptidoglycan-associated lipoprotein